MKSVKCKIGFPVDALRQLLAACILSLCLLLLCTGCVRSSPLSVTELRITDLKQARPAALSRYKNLERLDLRDVAATEELVDSLTQALPDCVILWRVPICGEMFDSAAVDFILPANTAASDLARLKYFHQLERLDATQCTLSKPLLDAADGFPDISFTWSVYGEPVTAETTQLNLSGQTIDDPDVLLLILEHFPAITKVDLTGAVVGSDALQRFATGQYRDILIRNVYLFGQTASAWAEALDLSAVTDVDMPVLQEGLRSFPRLEQVDISGYTASFDEMDALQKAYPAIRFKFSFLAFDQTLTSDTDQLDLSNTKFASSGEVAAQLNYLPSLREINLCNSGLSDVQMEQLVGAFPEVKFIWFIRIGGWSIRTDTTVFSKGQRKKFLNGMGEFLNDGKTNFSSEDLEPLKYCTDLVFLDLGHGNWITDLSILYSLPNLRALVLSMNKITDITPISSLQKLESLEIYQNYITDVSPLSELPRLKYLNLSVNSITDVTPLMGMKQLKKLWLVRDDIPSESKAALQTALPDCEICFWSWGSGSGGWRDNELYYEYQKAFNLPTLP